MDLLFYRWFFWTARHDLATELGPDAAVAVWSESLRLTRGLLVRVPDLGKPGARAFLVATCFLVAFHRALPGRSAERNAGLFADLVRSSLLRVPQPLRRLYRWMFFQPWYHRRLFAGVVGDRSLTGAGFVGRFIQGDAPGAFGVDYSECALQKFLRAVDCPELGPYVCQLDFVESEVFGLGLTRSGTLGQGARTCDFRWRRPDLGAQRGG